MKIGIVGTGRVATALSTGLKNRGLFISSIYGRNKEKSEKLAYDTDAVSLEYPVFEREDLVIVSVSDDALSEVVKQVKLRKKGAWMVHTCATRGLEVFDGVENYGVGVFYPLQSFSYSQIVAWNMVRFLIETQNEYLKLVLKSLTDRLGALGYYEMNKEQWLQIHVAAVFASNFTNLMLIHAEKVLLDSGFGLDFIKPLTLSTIQKAFELGPIESQTGPATRNDSGTIEKHLQILNQEQKQIYLFLSQAIAQIYQPKKDICENDNSL